MESVGQDRLQPVHLGAHGAWAEPADLADGGEFLAFEVEHHQLPVGRVQGADQGGQTVKGVSLAGGRLGIGLAGIGVVFQGLEGGQARARRIT